MCERQDDIADLFERLDRARETCKFLDMAVEGRRTFRSRFRMYIDLGRARASSRRKRPTIVRQRQNLRHWRQLDYQLSQMYRQVLAPLETAIARLAS